MAWDNLTFNSDFILLGIFEHSPIYSFLTLLLAILTVVCVGNTVMVLLILQDAQLHTPMYVLLSQLSLMLISTTVPKMAVNFLSGRKSISLAGCGTQIFLYVSLLRVECFLLPAMAYDPHVAVCLPLRYPLLMSPKLCAFLEASSWILGLLDGIAVIIVAMSFPYCHGQEIPYFSCDVPALLTLSCKDSKTFEPMMIFCCAIVLLFPTATITASNTRVLLAVTCMGSGKCHRKAFATCSSHLMVVGMYYGAAMFIYMRSMSEWWPKRHKMVSAFYTILTPMLNPLIYSLCNREVSRAFRKLVGKQIMQSK
ncbi:olfactory receptor 2M3 [Fukomys damarensis]|nr:olfactory receptor 2M3 [Fukomys damarensis]